ncbi:hypothetical protein BJ546DRAFT_23100 [Cryomyces antarcticus]
MSIPTLPDDILHLLCSTLADRLDFATLFSCAVSSKRMAGAGALANLYYIYHKSPIRGGGSEASPFAQQEQVVQKWSILWRSIVLSGLGKTLFPYCQYMRVLDLEDLGSFLDDDKFRGVIAKNFFSGELSKFHMVAQAPSNPGGRPRGGRLNIRAIIDAFGEVITEHAPMLEQITEPQMGNSKYRLSLPCP